MGYRVDTYSLQELSRIAMPGAVVPCLFWCIPVGFWPRSGLPNRNNRTVDAWWSWFTEQDTGCHRIGLLLIKSNLEREKETGHVDLKSLQATLTELMPPGAGRFIDAHASIGRGQQLLVLSAAYPQPGWGVLLECREPEQFEQLIDEAIQGLDREEAKPDLSSIVAARDLYRLRQRHEKGEPQRSDDLLGTETFDAAIRASRLIRDNLRDAMECLSRHDCDAGAGLLKEACRAALAGESNEEEPHGWNELAEQASLCQAAFRLSNARDIAGHERVQQLCDEIKASPRAQSRILKAVTNNEVKRAVGTCLSLMERGVADSAGECVQWANASVEPLVAAVAESARRELARLESRLAVLLGKKTLAEESWQRQRAAWLEQSHDLHAACRQATSAATETLWECGPSFLVEFERVCRKHGISVRSIPWDPARMVGWKLATCGIGLRAKDLWDMVARMAPDAPRPRSDENVDGSYFTDYVHYVAMSRPDVTPYSVTRDLLHMLRPTELERLIVAHGCEVDPEKVEDRSMLARQALDALGWREHSLARERSLADCLDEDAAGGPMLKADMRDLTKLRPVVESFCKDFIDTIAQEIGCDESQLWAAVRQRHPQYRSQRSRDSWVLEMKNLTVGAAALICEALLPLAFATSLQSVTTFCRTLRQLGAALNPSAHHNPELFSAEQPPDIDVAGLVKSLLDSAQGMIGEMPWHLEATAIYGEQPKVLSGLAWSHSSAIPRQIRVMDWTNAASGRSLTLWNKTGRNPIITDPVFIRRPGRG